MWLALNDEHFKNVSLPYILSSSFPLPLSSSFSYHVSTSYNGIQTVLSSFLPLLLPSLFSLLFLPRPSQRTPSFISTWHIVFQCASHSCSILALSTSQFHSKLKTHLFQKSFPPLSVSLSDVFLWLSDLANVFHRTFISFVLATIISFHLHYGLRFYTVFGNRPPSISILLVGFCKHFKSLKGVIQCNFFISYF